ncbi:hypothetical protein Tco_0644160 [Tanacetum coccineum]
MTTKPDTDYGAAVVAVWPQPLMAVRHSVTSIGWASARHPEGLRRHSQSPHGAAMAKKSKFWRFFRVFLADCGALGPLCCVVINGVTRCWWCDEVDRDDGDGVVAALSSPEKGWGLPEKTAKKVFRPAGAGAVVAAGNLMRKEECIGCV